MKTPLRTVPKVVAPTAPKRFVFLLLDQFTMLSFSSAVEPLRIANRMAGRKIYDWTLIGETPTVRCSAGIAFAVDASFVELDREDVLIVCGGMDVQKATTKPVLNWLRREARRGVAVGGLVAQTALHATGHLFLHLDGKGEQLHAGAVDRQVGV